MEKIVKSVAVLFNRLSSRLYTFGVGAFFCIFFLTMASIVKYPGTIVSSTNWTNYTVSQVGSDNAAYAYTTQTTSQPAVSRNYDFSTLPDDAVIEGIIVEVQISSNNATRIAYMKVRYSIDGGTNWSAYKVEQSQTGTSDSTKTFGANNDLWGLTPTAAQIKNTTNFRIDTAGRSSSTSYRCRVDFVRVTVYYHRVITSSLTESITFAELPAKKSIKPFSDSQSFAEGLLLKPKKVFVESVGIANDVANVIDLKISETQDLIENLSSSYQAKRILSDTINVTEKNKRKYKKNESSKIKIEVEEENGAEG